MRISESVRADLTLWMKPGMPRVTQKTAADPSLPHPNDDDLSLGTPVVQDDKR